MRPFQIGGAGAMLAGLALLMGMPTGPSQVHGQGLQGVPGLWLDHAGRAGVEIKNCGSEMCGNIVWLKEPVDPKGKPWTDMLNPDTSKRRQPVCGLQIIGGLKPGSSGLWQNGWIYDPEEGKNFDVELSLADTNTLKVFGYMGVRFLSETMLWKRMPVNNARCKA